MTAEQERAAIVAYLRGKVIKDAHPLFKSAMAWAAYAIESGDHLQP